MNGSQSPYSVATETWVSALERYVKRDLAVHVHWEAASERAIGGNGTEQRIGSGQFGFCLQSEYPGPRHKCSAELEMLKRRLGDDPYFRFFAACSDTGEPHLAMLVDVPQFVRYGEWLALGSVLPCHKRLYVPKVPNDRGVDSPKTLVPSPLPVLHIGDNREGDFLPLRVWPLGSDLVPGGGVPSAPLVSDTRRPSHVVERSPKPAHDVADHRPPIPSGRVVDSRDIYAYCVGVNALLGSDEVGGLVLDEAIDASIKFGQVFLYPVETGLNVPSCFTHSLATRLPPQQANVSAWGKNELRVG